MFVSRFRSILAYTAGLTLALLMPPAVWSSTPGNSRQLLLVLTEDWDSSAGTLRRFERQKHPRRWEPVGTATAVVVGRNGLAWGRGVRRMSATGALKKEGDGKAPAGMFRLGGAFGLSPEKLAGSRLSYRALRDDLECIDDAQSKHYNQLVRGDQVRNRDWHSSEKMWSEPLYKWGVLIEHNAGATNPGAGSCIFLHIWAGPTEPTSGCTAMPETDLVDVIRWLNPRRRPVVVQLPKSEYERLKGEWQLP